MTDLHDHLQSRHCNTEWYSCTIDPEEGVATFLLWNLSGQLVGYQQYRPDADKSVDNHPRLGRYYTRLGCEDESAKVKRAKHRMGVFGLESYHNPGPLYVVEGVFDAVRLHNVGLATIAVLQNDPKKLKGWLRSLGRDTVAVCDGDAAGRKLAKMCDQVFFVAEGRDLGDLSEQELEEFVCLLK